MVVVDVVVVDVVVVVSSIVNALVASHFINSFLYFSNCLLNSLTYFLYLKFDSPGSCSLFIGGTGRGCDVSGAVVVVTVVVVARCVIV